MIIEAHQAGNLASPIGAPKRRWRGRGRTPVPSGFLPDTGRLLARCGSEAAVPAAGRAGAAGLESGGRSLRVVCGVAAQLCQQSESRRAPSADLSRPRSECSGAESFVWRAAVFATAKDGLAAALNG